MRPIPGSVVRVFLLAFAVYAYFMPRWADWNIDSRFDLVRSMIDHRTLRIDRYHWNTWDKAAYAGHYYSDKAPGTAVLGAGVYALFGLARSAPISGGAISAVERNSAWKVAIDLGKTDTQARPAAKGRVLGGCQREGVAGNVQVIPWGNRLVPPFRDWALSKYVVTAGSVGLISAGFVAFFFWFLGVVGLAGKRRWILTSLFAVGTVALPYSTVLYSHQLVAAFLFVAFALLYLSGTGQRRTWFPAAAGLLLGAAFVTEYTVAIVIAVVGLYGLWRLRRSIRSLVSLFAASLVPLLGLAAYNAACFGSPLDTGYSHDFCWSTAQAGGFAGFTYPHLGPLFDLTVGAYRGLFFMSPFLFLAVPGAISMWRHGWKDEALVCVAVGIGFILAISAYWGWNGGQVDGPRYLVPVVPFLVLPVAFYLEYVARSVWKYGIAIVLGIWSLVVCWLLFLGGLTFPSSWLRNPLVDYSLPALSANRVAPNAGFFLGLSGWQSLLPLVLLMGIIGVARLPERNRRVPVPVQDRVHLDSGAL